MTEATTTEAMIDGKRSADDIRDLLRNALQARIKADTGQLYAYVYIADHTDDQVIYCVEGYAGAATEKLYQSSFAIDDAGAVTLGEPVEVVRTYTTAPAAASMSTELATEAAPVEQRDRVPGRVLEAKGKGEDGGRIFRVRIIAVGDSRNAKRYTEAVLTAASPLYEGAKAYDHHRSDEELRSSTIAGLVGSYRNVEASAEGLDADLCLLPSATHTAEALDATIAAQDDGLPPLVGVSHDVVATFKPIVDGGRRLQEAVAIVKVHSADVVADPAAGGKAVRAVAGGTDPDPAGTEPAADTAKESDVPATKADVLAALKDATDDELAAVGLSKAGTKSTESTPPEPTTTPTTTTAATEAVAAAQPKDSFLGRLMVKGKVSDAGLPEAVIESITSALPDRITESDVDAQVASIKATLGLVERAGLAPTVTTQVTKEALDKKTAALDAFFAGKYSEGYRSFREAYADITGKRPQSWGEDFNRTILRESFGQGYDADARRAQESLITTSWDVILGDSVTRRMIAEYAHPDLTTWRRVVSSVVPLSDFRTQRIERLGGYGVLPAVNQGAPYQPLTSPGDEEATYALTKRGGTEDLTLEMIANDDVRAITRIPRKLGLAAAQTLYRFVFDFFTANASTTYDSVALFHASHGNTTTGALNQSNLSAARVAMADQAAYGDSSDILDITPRLILVPNELEEIAFQLTRSAVAVPATPAGPSDTPNIHQGTDYLKIPYWTDANDWYLTADPTMCPTFEIGFYLGREEPELFTQADQNVGSMFNADKMTLKIRHIYSGAAVEHRGLYRSTN